MDKNIRIFNYINQGEPLIEGEYDSEEIEKFLLNGKCKCEDYCDLCDGTGRIDDIYIEWADETIRENVYEYTNY